MFWQSRLGVLLKHFFDSRLDTEFCRDDLTHRMIFFASIAHSSSCDIRLLLTSEKNCESCERFSDFYTSCTGTFNLLRCFIDVIWCPPSANLVQQAPGGPPRVSTLLISAI